MTDKKTAVGLSALFLAVIAVMLVLLPIERKNEYYKKWGKLAVLAETDERAKFAIENAELYPDYWFKMLYSDDEGDFNLAYNYPFLKDNYQNMSFTDEELNCEEVPALYMNDVRWGYEMNGAVKEVGCAAVAITMANLYLNHNGGVDPVKIIQYADEMGYYGFGGIERKDVPDIIEHFGMNVEEHVFEGENSEKITEAELKAAADTEGAVLIVAAKGATFGSHALIIRGYDENGFYINDPAHAEKTAKQWDFEVFENELVRYWVVTK